MKPEKKVMCGVLSIVRVLKFGKAKLVWLVPHRFAPPHAMQVQMPAFFLSLPYLFLLNPHIFLFIHKKKKKKEQGMQLGLKNILQYPQKSSPCYIATFLAFCICITVCVYIWEYIFLSLLIVYLSNKQINVSTDWSVLWVFKELKTT